jgi:hypothetical protein
VNRIRKIQHSEFAYYFLDNEENMQRKYGRIMGGLCFPAHKPGFVVVAAEEFSLDPVMRAFPIHIIDEYSDTDMQGLLRKCLEYSNTHSVEYYVGDLDNKPAMDYLSRFTRDLREHPVRISGGESFEFSLNITKDRLKGQTLHIPEESSLKAALWEVPVSEVQAGNPYDYPKAAALGWVVAHFDTWRRSLYDATEDKEEDYDPLRFGLRKSSR